ncbi:MAG: hypothetical protein DMG44_14325 [Acidobacteria bacterium]|nr:MAG: hypothetical protein DMG44_14325 [Acidobacteriota bacterium]
MILPLCSAEGTQARMKRMRRTLLLITIILLALVAARGVAAAPQSKGSATLTGTVLGPDDRPVAHASVSYQSSSGNAPHAVHTDSRGQFTIRKLRADNYDIRASGKGVFSEWEKNVSLRTGQTKELTLRLIYARKIPKAYVKSKPQQ